MPRDAARCHKMPRDAVRCHEMPQDATSCHKIARDAERCRDVQRDAEQCQDMPRDTKRCRGMPQDAGRYHACFARQLQYRHCLYPSSYLWAKASPMYIYWLSLQKSCSSALVAEQAAWIQRWSSRIRSGQGKLCRRHQESFFLCALPLI